MKYLLDTVAASEFAKAQPNAGLLRWLLAADEDSLFLSVATLAEIRFGIELMPIGRRRAALENWLMRDLPVRFEDRIVQISPEIAEEWGRVSARRKAKGRADDAMDALIAATANVLGMSIVTRNDVDFEGFTRNVLNPWT